LRREGAYLSHSECDLMLTIRRAQQNVPYIFVESKAALGRACNVSRPVIAASVTTSEHRELQSQLETIKRAIDQIMV